MTYPTPSAANNETVCTAGITDDGRWVRLYPIDYRYLNKEKRYKKWQYITIAMDKASGNDQRRESHKVDVETIVLQERLDSKADKTWKQRRALIDPMQHSTYLELRKQWEVDYQKWEENRNAIHGWTSLGVVRPTEILDFTWERRQDPEWSEKERQSLAQLRFFGEEVESLKKLPYIFRIKFKCADSPKPHEIMIEDWETGTLYWNCCEWGRVPDEIALPKMRERYMGDVLNLKKRDVRIFMGTTGAKNTWLIVGVFAPPRIGDENQQRWY